VLGKGVRINPCAGQGSLISGGEKSVKKIALLIGSAIAALATVTPASAAIFTYSITGTGTASLNGNIYSGNFKIAGTGDNSVDLNPSPIITAYRMDSFTVTFGSDTVSAVFPIAFFTNNQFGVAGFVQVLPPFTPPFIIQDVFDVGNPIFNTYDPTTPLGPINVNFLGAFNPLFTNAGLLSVIGRPTDLVFTAGPLGAGGVPEPANWALMIAGFGLAGTALRRKPKVSVRFA
jgi:PEP-CTERM motif